MCLSDNYNMSFIGIHKRSLCWNLQVLKEDNPIPTN